MDIPVQSVDGGQIPVARARTGIRVLRTDRAGSPISPDGIDHDRWQRATLACAVVGRDRTAASERADAVERWVRERFPDGCAIERAELSGDEALGR